ncbi:MAG TPA: tetratricopeptide repeat protein, partial [Thermoanaerobaculia bacterium]|nr:tetratricopeptide repeat protein [Thermoanaerobaculia bacterium]
HNLIGFLNESGQSQEALSVLEQTRSLYLTLGEQTHLIRLRWLEGRICRDLGRLDEAETALREARDGFIEHGIGFDAARASLDLATVYLQQGRTGELKRVASEMVPIFESRDVHQEALAALLLFRQAADAEEVTLGLLERIAGYLRRARQNPDLRFEGN